ncbi:MAG: alpha-L-fucosidase, partial [Prevotella sp.]|nr:alpha-L-fucosidase [Prevotella sp.]
RRRYAIYCPSDDAPMPTQLSWSVNLPSRRLTLLSTGKRLKHSIDGQGRVIVTLPKGLTTQPIAIRIE